MKPDTGKAPLGNGTLTLSLHNPSGTLYDKVAQTEAMLLSYGNATPGGWALVAITANGDAITIPGTWIQWGGDAVSAVADDINHLSVLYKDANTIYYTNKVV